MASDDKVNILLVDDQPAKLLSYETILAGLGEAGGAGPRTPGARPRRRGATGGFGVCAGAPLTRQGAAALGAGGGALGPGGWGSGRGAFCRGWGLFWVFRRPSRHFRALRRQR